MQSRWLAILGCLLITACSETATKDIAKNKDEPVKSVSPEPVKSELKADANVETKSEANVEIAAEAKSPAEQFEAAKSRYDAARNDFMALYQKAPEADRATLVKEKLPKPEDYASEFLKIAAENPKDSSAFDSLMWVANNVRSGEPAKLAFNALFAEHIDNEKLADICATLGYSMPSQEVEDRLNRLIEESPHDGVKAAAMFYLANYLNSVERASKYVKENPDADRFDEETLAYVEKFEPQSQVIETMYQTLISDYPDLMPSARRKKTYRELAEAALFEMNNLAIGLVAPEIEGTDFDGTSFKLSDYRGKVVVLDFWGDW